MPFLTSAATSSANIGVTVRSFAFALVTNPARRTSSGVAWPSCVGSIGPNAVINAHSSSSVCRPSASMNPQVRLNASVAASRRGPSSDSSVVCASSCNAALTSSTNHWTGTVNVDDTRP